MLVTLGSNSSIAAGASQTFQYACSSVQSVAVRCDDDATSMAGHVTVQIGNKVICNDIDFEALSKISLVNGGGMSSDGDSYFNIDFGSHVLDPLENLYVTIRATTAIVAVDVSAIVNEGGVYQPLKWTNYSDSVFTDSNTLCVYAWANATLENDTSAFTIRNQAYSATPQVQSGVLQSLVRVQGDGNMTADAKQIGIMAKNQVPLDTSINYSSTDIDGVVCISAMEKTTSKAQRSKESGNAILRAMTTEERKAI